jgi:GDSL-like Lipase/Acylhydrolase family
VLAVGIASLVLNVLLLGLLGRSFYRHGLREFVIKHGIRRLTDRDFAAAATVFVPGAPGGVVVIGDSQVANAPLLDMLTPVRNRGLARARISNTLSWIDGVLAEQPSRVVLMIGSNDAYYDVPVADSVSSAGQLLDRIGQQPDCAVTMLSIPPLPGHERAVIELNGGLMALALKRGCAWVDLTPTLAAMHWTDDSVHLNAAAYRAVAPLIASGLVSPPAQGADLPA